MPNANNLTNASYVLITPAHNEESYIEKTIQSVISQTILPKKWVVVSDGSTDGTDDIIRKYAELYSFIEFTRTTDHNESGFGSKALAIDLGYQKLEGMEYEFVGNLDADITFDPDYYERILMKFSENDYASLGIAGGMIAELQDGKFTILTYNTNSVAGAVQLFRRQCFEGIGGYRPLKLGGIDALAEVMSRMRGWEVKSFKNIIAYHHRRIGTTRETLVRSKIRYGLKEYSTGTHPIFMFLKCVHRFKEKPYIIGGVLMLSGYFWSWIRREPKAISDEIVRFVRHEQVRRITSKILCL